MAADLAPAGPGDGGLGIAEIMALLPHRYPVLLIDRVTACEPGERITGYKCIGRDEWWVAAPSKRATAPTLPRAFVLEAMAQLSIILAIKTLELTGDHLFFFAGIDATTFTGDARPGDILSLEASVVRIMRARGIGKFSTAASVSGRPVARATMIASMRKA